MNKFRDMKYKTTWKIQKLRKGYSDFDLYSIYSWFIETFPKMLGEFAEQTCGYPMTIEKLQEEVYKFPVRWVEKQIPIIEKIGKQYDIEYDLNDGYVCWLLIILRMKYCFEMCNECHPSYLEYHNKEFYDLLDQEVLRHKTEAFYLFDKFFFDLWW